MFCKWETLPRETENTDEVFSLFGGNVASRNLPEVRERGMGKLLGAGAQLTAAELQALQALLVPLRAHATGTTDRPHCKMGSTLFAA
jgi:hypothetical protein